MRLFVQLYLSFVAVGVLCIALVGGLAVVFADGMSPWRDDMDALAQAWAETLPAEPVARQRELTQLATRLNGALVLWDKHGRVLGATGDVPYGPPGLHHSPRGGGLRVQLADGRTLGYRTTPPPRRHARFVLVIGTLCVGVALGCWPVARRLSRRLEALRDGAAAWGDGRLDARVAVSGHDELADVARAFNRAASRVEALVGAQQRVLASVSHELRSPLARLRLIIELLDGDDALRDKAAREIGLLDELVGDLLRSARMDARERPEQVAPVDLRALLDGLEGVQVRGAPYVVAGDARLLERLLRNLVENAQKYGQAPIIAETTDDGLAVSDAGTALPLDERERVFEPFYRRAGHAEGVHGGVGLGLALVRQIARLHGGDATYTDVNGRTCLRVTLPRAPGGPA